MDGKRIGIVVGGAGAIPEAAIKMAQEHDVELVKVEDIKQEEYEPTRIPEQVYTIHPLPEIPDTTLYDPPLKNITPEVAVLFAEILNCITSACNEAELRRGMELIKMRHYQFSDLFTYGFGSHHLWVNQANRRNRLIFVEF